MGVWRTAKGVALAFKNKLISGRRKLLFKDFDISIFVRVLSLLELDRV